MLMANKKPSKSSKTKTVKTTKTAPVDHNHIGKCFIAFGLIITALLFGLFYLMGQSKTYAEKQKLLAFDGLVETYLYDQNFVEGEQVATVLGSGLTDDDDLYYDFVITKLEDHVPISARKGRLHFQCHEQDSLNLKDYGCARAYWYDDWVDTSAEYRATARTLIDYLEDTAARTSAATTESEKQTIRKEYNEFMEKYKDFSWSGLE